MKVLMTADTVGARGTQGSIGQDASKFPTVPPTTHDPVASSNLGIAGTCPSCDFTAAAQGNVDNDSDADSWAIRWRTRSSSSSAARSNSG